MDVRDQDVAEILRELLEELRAIRQEMARHTNLLEATLAKLGDIERTQYS
ncbi:MAG: hypothetical protein H0U82_00885 [Actinobacteria bacterium]|nr:hypothetical protein [Actinomycetota bacterium]